MKLLRRHRRRIEDNIKADLKKWLGRRIGANGAKPPVYVLHKPMPRCSQRSLPIMFPFLRPEHCRHFSSPLSMQHV